MKRIVVITSYPKKDNVHGSYTVGVASYAKNTLSYLKKAARNNLSITVLAEKLPYEKNYTHENIQVKRLWDRNSLLLFPTLLKKIRKDKKTDTVVIEFELAMFGELFYLLPFPLFLLALRLMGKNVVVVLHQVLTHVEEVGSHAITLPDNSTIKRLLNLGLKLFYFLLIRLSSKIIVFEENLKDKLSRYGDSKKINIIPHGVESTRKISSKKSARRKLHLPENDFIVLVFGFLAWYKGTDWILHAVSHARKEKKNRNIKLILAGGPNPNHKDKAQYSRYIASLMRTARELDVSITGFVPEEQISTYYNASDVVVLPYRTHMSASGPLSMAFTFKKPFLLSNSLKDILSQEDIAKSMNHLKISSDKLTFKEQDDFIEKVYQLKKNKKLQGKLSILSEEIAHSRNWDAIGRRYYEELIK